MENPFKTNALILYVGLYTLPLILIFDLGGYFPEYLATGLTFLLLALPLLHRDGRSAAWGAAGLALALAIRNHANLPPIANRLLLLAAHQWIWRDEITMPRGATAGLVFFTALHLFMFDSPAGYSFTEQLVGLGNRTAESLTGRFFHLGPTYQGTGVLLLFVCLSLFGRRRGDRIGALRTIAFLGIAVLLLTLLNDLMLEKLLFDIDLTWEFSYRDTFGFREMLEKSPNMAVLFVPLAHFTALLVLFTLFQPGDSRPMAGLAAPTRRFALSSWWVLPLWLTLIAVVTPPTAWLRPEAREILFIDRGIVSYSKPDDTRFGRGAGGMFGMLPEYARLFGCKTTVTTEVPDKLDPQSQILMFTNLNAPTPAAELRRIWEFVKAGGSLWVLGDHTFIKDGRHHINDLLAPCDIKLKNDSAFFFPQGWFHSYRFPQGTSFSALTETGDNRPGFLVGASLALEGTARPFMLGCFGYGDIGLEVPNERGSHMGDSTFQRDERLGDLPLVAGQRFGRGRVLVFGDTTSFFNHMMPGSYELLRSSLSWLGTRPAWPAAKDHGTLPAALLLLFGIAAIVCLGRAAPPGVAFCVMGLLCSVVMHRPSGQLPWDRAFARQTAVITDFTHHPDASKHGNMSTGLHGVSINLMRRGLLPLDPPAWDSELLDMAAGIVLSAPRQSFNNRALRDLHDFMERGGTVILACGHPHYEAVRPLLEPLGLRVRGIPLGRFFDSEAFGRRISFFSAWPIEINPVANVAVLSIYNNWPLIVSAPMGHGRLVLIADSEFFQNRNLESSQRHDPANIRFVRELFERINEEPHPW